MHMVWHTVDSIEVATLAPYKVEDILEELTFVGFGNRWLASFCTEDYVIDTRGITHGFFF